MGGSAKPVVSAVGGAGKSAPQTQNNYGSAYQAPSAQVYQPTYGGMLGGGGAPSSGGKSSGAGQGGYGGAPGFQQPMQGGFGGMLGGGGAPSGGKSLGGVTPYGSAPGFGGQPFDPRFSPAQMESRLRFQGSRLEGDNIVDASGRRIGAIGGAAPMQGGFGQIRLGTPEEQAQARANVRQLTPEESTAQFIMNARRAESFAGAPQLSNQGLAQRGMQGGFDPQAPTQEAYRGFKAMTGSPMSFEEYSQNAMGKLQQPQFNPYQQSPFNPYQQPMQQPGFSGLQDLFNMMMGQNMGGFNRPMPQYQSPASMYRPDMQAVQQNLSRVRPSVQKQRQDEQANRIRELEAELEGLRQPALQSYYDYGGGG